MNKTWLYCLMTLALGIIIGAFLMLIIYPFLFPPAVVNEKIINPEAKVITAIGSFSHANPSDPLHWGEGTVEIYHDGQYFEIFLNSDFEVGPGPDYYLYLSSSKQIENKEDFRKAKNMEIGQLKSFTGSQVYQLKKDIDFTEFNSVVVWCKSFGQLISPATLNQ